MTFFVVRTNKTSPEEFGAKAILNRNKYLVELR